jgi:hypothetical protein
MLRFFEGAASTAGVFHPARPDTPFAIRQALKTGIASEYVL